MFHFFCKKILEQQFKKQTLAACLEQNKRYSKMGNKQTKAAKTSGKIAVTVTKFKNKLKNVGKKYKADAEGDGYFRTRMSFEVFG